MWDSISNASVLSWLHLAARFAIAVVFATAGIAKLRDAKGTMEMLRAFGVPILAQPMLGRCLPVIELVLALALLPSVSAQLSGGAAALLLTTFTGFIAAQLALGRHPDCRCFGAASATPIDTRTLARNIVLLAVALFIAMRPAEDSPALQWASKNAIGLAIGSIAFAFAATQTFLMFQIIHQQGRILIRLGEVQALPASTNAERIAKSRGGLPVGTPAPAFELPTLAGNRATLADLLEAGEPLLLVFLHPSCGPCSELLPDVARWQSNLRIGPRVIIISSGKLESNRVALAAHPGESVLLQNEYEVSEMFRAYGTPTAVLISANGQIASPVVAGAEAVRALHKEALSHVNDSSRRTQVNLIGAPAPGFSARTTDGKLIRLVDFVGRDMLIVFWNPDCQFCRGMSDELVAFDKSEGPAGLLIVSAREDTLLPSRGFRSPIVIDQAGTINAEFNVRGTPMALRIDADGRIASDTARGKDGVMRLFREMNVRLELGV